VGRPSIWTGGYGWRDSAILTAMSLAAAAFARFGASA
jgi:hypothetical protein